MPASSDNLDSSPTNPGSESQPGPEGWEGYSSERLLALMAEQPTRQRATTGLRARLGMKASKREQEFLLNRDRMCVSFGEPVSAVVVNPKGGVGKTPLTLLLAGALARARAGGVIAFEDHELRGTMHLRLKPDPAVPPAGRTTVRDLIRDLGQVPPERIRSADVARYVRHQASGQFDALVSARAVDDQITRDEYERVLDVLGRFYPVTVVDTANNEQAPAWRAAVERATVLVVVLKWAMDAVLPAAQMIEDLQSDPRLRVLARHAVVVASQNVAEGDLAVRAKYLPYLRELSGEVIEIAPDAHIAARGPIVHDQLSAQTLRTVDRAGASVCMAAQNVLAARRAGTPAAPPPVPDGARPGGARPAAAAPDGLSVSSGMSVPQGLSGPDGMRGAFDA